MKEILGKEIVCLFYVHRDNYKCIFHQTSSEKHTFSPAVFRDRRATQASGLHHPLLGQTEAAGW